MAGIDIGQISGLLQEAFSTEDGLRRLLESVVNAGMRAEASEHVGADPHERSAARRGHRNGASRGRLRRVRENWSFRFRRCVGARRTIRACLPNGSGASGRSWLRARRCTSKA
jgi:transposase-like protein